jgi:hypothetical protein
MKNDNADRHNSLDCGNRTIQRRMPLSIGISLLTTLTFLLLTFPLSAQDNGLNFSGDFRLRFEMTTKQQPTSSPSIRNPRYREVVRFRLGMNKQINDYVKFGSRLATGSPDDPNTADITLGDFVNDLTVSLDKLYMEILYKNLFLTGGKFGNPFLRTDLVWDGDVNPQGVAGSITVPGSEQIMPKLTGIYYVVDEQTINPDSYMWGGQAKLSIRPNTDWKVTLAAGFYDYTIKSLTDADAGDTRSNYLTFDADSNLVYLSDFNLIDVIAVIEYSGLSERFPLKIVADFVKNNGAEVDEDQAFGVDFFLGKASKQNDFRFQYGYAKSETDAVLAAFSHDNLTIATNFEQHTIGIDFVALEKTTLNLTFYYYRLNKVDPSVDNDYFSRLRLNAILAF